MQDSAPAVRNRLTAWAKCLAVAVCLTSSVPGHAQSQTIQLAVEEIQPTENCGIQTQLITRTISELAESKGLKLRRSKADLILFADVNVLPIPNSLGRWSKSCSFNINIELQRHQEIKIEGIGEVLVSAKLCDSGYAGYISDGNLGFFEDALDESFQGCLAKLPKRVLNAIKA